MVRIMKTAPDTGDEGAPRWVKVFGIIGIVLVLVFIIMHLAGLGLGGHTPAGTEGDPARPDGGRR
jgi:hypothetical protein